MLRFGCDLARHDLAPLDLEVEKVRYEASECIRCDFGSTLMPSVISLKAVIFSTENRDVYYRVDPKSQAISR